jgi:hypothetical protein
MRWTTPASIAEQVLVRWNRGEILAARLTGETLFPLEMRLKGPSAREVADRFGEVQDWTRDLARASSDSRGFGFALRLETLRNRVQGRNELPVAAIIATESDALRLIRRQAEAERFEALADSTLACHPTLRPWLVRHPLIALEHAEHWERLLAVLDWFAAHPRPGLYLRQLDIPGVDTKFIESHRRLLTELLDAVLPEQAVEREASGVRRFNQRYGLRSDPPLVRFRLLDPALYICGLDDLSLPPEQFATLKVPVRRVFFTENRTNGLAFPDCAGSLVVFGLGYGLERLAQVTWLGDVEVHYWGDLDTHGFGILNRLRATLPDSRSFLMDRKTLDAHRTLWGQEPADKRYSGQPSRLTRRERALFDDLRMDRLGERVRLEQERIGFGWLKRALEDVLAAGKN